MTTHLESEAEHLSTKCENCSADLRGPFCHSCGQRAEPLPTSMLGYLGRLMTGIVGYDSRVLRSFIGLLFRPGLLTVEYIRGRRIHYVEPLQIYLLSAAAFFLVHAYRPFIQFNTETGGATSTLGPASATGNLSETAIQRIEAQGISLEVFAERFDAWVSAYLPALLLALLAVFTLLIWALNWRSQKTFATHAVFTLHWSAFYLILEGVFRVVPIPNIWSVAISLVYLVVALRMVYQRNWLISAIKALVSLTIFYTLISMWMASALGLAGTFAR